MKKFFERAFLVASMLVASLSCEAADGGEVLWWMIGDNYSSIEGTATDGTTMTAGELKVTDARVRYEGADGSKGYLKLYGLDEGGNVYSLDGVAGVGLPAEYFADLSGLSGTSYSFVLELGNWKEGNWVHTSMESQAASYESLVANKHISQWHETTPTYGTPWNPTTGYTVVPEPSSGLMLLVGGALLMLRRRRRG
jgi:hypothetical protein